MATSGSFSGSIYSGHYKLRVDWSASQDIANNKSKITTTMYLERDYSISISSRSDNTTSIDGQSSTYSSPSISGSGSGTTKLGSVSKTVTHNADGTKSLTISSVFYIRATLDGTYYEKITASKTITLDTIPRTSSVSGGTGNIGGTTTINISRASSSFTHKLYYAFGSIGKTLIASNVGTSYTWTIPTSFYAQIPNANSGTGTIYCETIYNGSVIGTTTCSFTAKVINSNPTFTASNISYQDTNTTITAITGNNQHIVRNKSSLRVSFTGATAHNSASISRYEITFNGATQTKTGASTIDYGTVNLSANATVTIKVTDSRGNTATASKTITILDWVNPTAAITLKRLNNYEDTTYFKVVGSISSVNSKNSIQSITYKYKKSTDSSYSAQTTISNNTQYTLTYAKAHAWNFQIVITDKFGSTTYNVVLAKGMPLMFIDSNKISVGINCFPAKNNSFELNGKTIFDLIYPVGSIYISANTTNPATLFGGTWEQIKDRFLLASGNSYSNGSTGGNASINLQHSHTSAKHSHSSAKHSHGRGNLIAGLNWQGGACFYQYDSAQKPTANYKEKVSYTESEVSQSLYGGVRVIGNTGETTPGNTGETTPGNTGNALSTSQSILPPYLTVCVWKRTA